MDDAEPTLSAYNGTNADAEDDASLLIRHARLEAASIRAAVLAELRHCWARDNVGGWLREHLLDELAVNVDTALRTHIEAFIAFQTLLLQRAAASVASAQPAKQADAVPRDLRRTDAHALSAQPPLSRILDRTVISDRAALLRVRLALEPSQASAPTVAPSVSAPAPASTTYVADGNPKTKSRTTGVRWALSIDGSDGISAAARRKSSSSLCMHAFETLRGSVQAMEEKQPSAQTPSASSPSSGSSPHGHGACCASDAIEADSSGANRVSDHAQRSIDVQSHPSPAHARASEGSDGDGACPYDAAHVREGLSVASTVAAGARPAIKRTSSNGGQAAPQCNEGGDPAMEVVQQPSMPSKLAQKDGDDITGRGGRGTGSRWDVVRSVVLTRMVSAVAPRSTGSREGARASSGHGPTRTRRATIHRIMASEPGAEESDLRDLRQLQMLRQGSCCRGGQHRRVAPASASSSDTSRNSKADSEGAMQQPPTPALSKPDPKSFSAKLFGRSALGNTSSSNLGSSSSSCKSGNSVKVEDKDAGELSHAGGAPALGSNVQSYAPPVLDASFKCSKHAQSSDAAGASQAAAEEHRTLDTEGEWEEACTRSTSHGKPAVNIIRRCPSLASKEDTPRPIAAALGSAEAGTDSSGTARPVPTACKERRASVADTQKGSMSRRGSIETLFPRGTRRGSSTDGRAVSRRNSIRNSRLRNSRRTSGVASRRGSLTDMYLSLQATTVARRDSLAAVAAFLLADVSAEPGLQEIKPQRSRPKHVSAMSSSSSVRGEPPLNNTACPHGGHDPASMQSSFLGAVGGDPQASARLRASLTECPGLRRGSICSAPGFVHDPAPADHTDDASLNELLQQCLERRRSSVQSYAISTPPRRSSVQPGNGGAGAGASSKSSLEPGTSMDSATTTMMRGSRQGAAVPTPLVRQDSYGGRAALHPAQMRTPLAAGNESATATEQAAASPEAPAASLLWPRYEWCQCLCARYDHLPLVVLHPLSRLRLYWDAILATLALWCLCEVPMRVVFSPTERFSYMPVRKSLCTFPTCLPPDALHDSAPPSAARSRRFRARRSTTLS